MAWTNIPTFTVGQVLTAATMNNMRVNATIGHTICTSSSRPAGVDTGTMIYETDTGYARVYDGTLWRQASPAPTVTSLPASPVDGDEVVYVANATNGVSWRLRYRAASASSYKWEFVGGAELRSEGVGGTTWGTWNNTNSLNHVNTNVSLTVPLAGDYAFNGELISYNNAGDSAIGALIWRASYGTVAWSTSHATHYAFTSYQATTMNPKVTHTGLAASETVYLRVAVSLATAPVYFYNCSLWCQPVRVG